MRRLICTFAARIWQKQVFSCRGSYSIRHFKCPRCLEKVERGALICIWQKQVFSCRGSYSIRHFKCPGRLKKLIEGRLFLKLGGEVSTKVLGAFKQTFSRSWSTRKSLEIYLKTESALIEKLKMFL